jgi:hypothetical protein
MTQLMIHRSIFALLAASFLAPAAFGAAGPGGDELDQRIDNAAANVKRDRPWRTGGPEAVAPAPRLGTYDPAAANVMAQRQAKWRFSFTPFFWAPAMHGNTTVGNQTVDVDASIGDVLQSVFDNFEFAAMGRFEANYCRWSVLLDVIYLNLGNEDDVNLPGAGQIDADWEFHELIAQGLIGYRFAELPLGCGNACFRPTVTFDALAGVRYYHFKSEINLDPGPNFDATKNWADPVVGVRTLFHVTPALSFNVMANIGGFGVGSDLSWELIAGVDYKLTNCISLTAGWAILDIDYESGGFGYDVTMSGPYLGATFRF